MTAIEERRTCPNCGDSGTSEDHCRRCGAFLPDQPTPPTEPEDDDDLGPEPEYKVQPINQRCAPCRGCGERFIEWDKGVTGDNVRVYREDDRWVRFHEHCWPWSTS